MSDRAPGARWAAARWVPAALVLTLTASGACGGEEAAAPAPPDVEARADAPGGPPPVAILRVRDLGEVRVALLPEQAPRTVANFEKLAEEGFYDGTTFHRVVPGFVIQGGDPNTRDRDPRNDGAGGPGYTIPDEFNEGRHLRGAVSMANKGQPQSGGSQFFLVLADAPHLDGRHAVFGRVVAGLDVVDRIAAVETDRLGRHGPRDRPLEDVVVESVTIDRRDGAAGE